MNPGKKNCRMPSIPCVEAVPRAPPEVVGEVGRSIVYRLADHLRFLAGRNMEANGAALLEISSVLVILRSIKLSCCHSTLAWSWQHNMFSTAKHPAHLAPPYIYRNEASYCLRFLNEGWGAGLNMHFRKKKTSKVQN